MKILLVLLVSLTSLQGQMITEILDTYSKKYNNIFSSQGATLRMDFMKQYPMNQEANSEYTFIISIQNVETTNTGMTYSGAFFGGIHGGGISATYETNEYGGMVEMSIEELRDLFACANSVYSYINSRQSIPGINATSATCHESGISLIGEYHANPEYYFSVENATFKMTTDDFMEIMQIVQKSLRTWESLRSP